MKYLNKNRLLLILFSLVACVFAQAQTQNVKNIEVSGEDSYTGNISLSPDSRDMEIMVKVQFDEAENTLTVSLISYRQLFVFRDDARYKQVVKRNKIKVEALPYVAACAPTDQFVLTKTLRKLLPKNKKKFVFQHWIDYDGMVPKPQEYKMVNDFIEQTFDIKPGRDIVSFTLGDVLVMDKSYKSKRKRTIYDLVYMRDLDTKYVVKILRDPCFGEQQAIESTSAACEGIKKAFATLSENFPGGKASSQEHLDAFKDVKATLTKQFPRNDLHSDCKQLNELVGEYNQYVDSIAAFSCTLTTVEVHQSVDKEIEEHSIDAVTLLSIARSVDRMTSQWLTCTDANERRMLLQQCQKIISSAEEMVQRAPLTTEAQKNAYDTFKKACKYYNDVVKGK